jgi:hypothetical protein
LTQKSEIVAIILPLDTCILLWISFSWSQSSISRLPYPSLYPLQKTEKEGKLMRLYFASSPNIPDSFIGYKLLLSHNQEKSSNRYSLEYRARKSTYYLRSWQNH